MGSAARLFCVWSQMFGLAGMVSSLPSAAHAFMPQGGGGGLHALLLQRLQQQMPMAQPGGAQSGPMMPKVLPGTFSSGAMGGDLPHGQIQTAQPGVQPGAGVNPMAPPDPNGLMAKLQMMRQSGMFSQTPQF